LYVNYLPDGRLKDSGYYKQGLKSGIWVHFQSQTGLLWKGHYKNGFPQKEWKAYNVDGNLQELLFYNEDGKLQWRKKYKSAP
jgi:antitoxin component YwqK of YwqJK toxin-antitoxin module